MWTVRLRRHVCVMLHLFYFILFFQIYCSFHGSVESGLIKETRHTSRDPQSFNSGGLLQRETLRLQYHAVKMFSSRDGCPWVDSGLDSHLPPAAGQWTQMHRQNDCKTRTVRWDTFNCAGVTQFQSDWESVVGLAHQAIHFEGGGTVVPWGTGKNPTDWMWQTHRDASEVTCSYISLQKTALQSIDFMEVSKYVLKSFLLFWPICLKYTHACIFLQDSIGWHKQYIKVPTLRGQCNHYLSA